MWQDVIQLEDDTTEQWWARRKGWGAVGLERRVGFCGFVMKGFKLQRLALSIYTTIDDRAESSSSSPTLFSRMTFKKTVSKDAFSTVYSIKWPWLDKTPNSFAKEKSPCEEIGTSKRVATSSAIREPGISAINIRALITSSLEWHVKCTSYEA